MPSPFHVRMQCIRGLLNDVGQNMISAMIIGVTINPIKSSVEMTCRPRNTLSRLTKLNVHPTDIYFDVRDDALRKLIMPREQHRVIARC
jgi:hypothetical protein